MSSNIFNDNNKDIIVTVKFSKDNEIKKLNKKYLKRDYTTDVLSFEINQDNKENFYLGDVIVNINAAKKQAQKYSHTMEEEIAELAAHGILHLLGVHHSDDDEKTVHGIKVK